jgi:hypothetical protein
VKGEKSRKEDKNNNYNESVKRDGNLNKEDETSLISISRK